MVRLAKIGAALFTIIVVSQVVALAVSRPGYQDPFAPFEELLAGQVVTTATPCDLNPVPPDSPEMLDSDLSYCAIYPQGGAFASVSAYRYENQFVHTAFRAASLRERKDLVIADVVLHWGRPDVIITYEQSLFLRWNERRLVAMIYPRGTTTRYSYWLPIASMSIGLSAYSEVLP